MDLVPIQSTGFAATSMTSPDRLTERVRGGDDAGNEAERPARPLDYAGRPMFARCLILLVLSSQPPVPAASPTETMEAFFEQANVLLRGADRTRGVEETRQAIRQLVNDMIEFREAAAHALGPAWSSRSQEDQNDFIELF